MTRGNGDSSKVVYKGTSHVFVVIVEALDELENWRKDSSVPLARVVDGWKVFVTQTQGSGGILDEASNAALENEFGTHNLEEVIQKILKDGTVQHSQAQERSGNTNMAQGSRSNFS